MDMLDGTLGEVVARSSIIESAPVGPSQRRYANAALVIESRLSPPGMLRCLHEAEAAFGRERRGERWRARTLDLDLILWSGGAFAGPGLTVPHPRFRERDFVLGPAARIAPRWRDPLTGLTLSHLYARLTRPKPLPR